MYRENLSMHFESHIDRRSICQFVRKLLIGAANRRTSWNTRISLAGVKSVYGEDYDSFATMARMLPLAATWLRSNPNECVIGQNDKAFSVDAFIREAIISGTDPDHPGYWGPMFDRVSRLVEVNDIVWALWLTRDKIFETFNAKQKKAVVGWIGQVYNKVLWNSNWQFTPVLVHIFKVNSGFEDDFDIKPYLACLNEMYTGDGWYSDELGNETYDYYNAWQIHFSFLMVYLMDEQCIMPASLMNSALERVAKFLNHFPYLFGGNGVHIPFGRSLSYRMAVLGTLILARYADCSPLPIGLEKRLILRNLQYFFKQPILTKDGFLSCGFTEQPHVPFEIYMFYGSPYWASRGLLAILFDEKHQFWLAKEEPLPVEQGDFEHQISSTGFLLVGKKETGEVRLYNSKNYSVKQKWSEPFYSKLTYSSHFFPSYDRTNQGFAPDSVPYAIDEQGRQFLISGIENGNCTTKCIYRIMTQGLTKRDKAIKIESMVVPYGEYAVHVHRIHSNIPVTIIQGSFPLLDLKSALYNGTNFSYLHNENSCVLIKILTGFEKLEDTNSWGEKELTNIIGKQVRFITAQTPKVANLFTCSLVQFASPRSVPLQDILDGMPKVRFDDQLLTLSLQSQNNSNPLEFSFLPESVVNSVEADISLTKIVTQPTA